MKQNTSSLASSAEPQGENALLGPLIWKQCATHNPWMESRKRDKEWFTYIIHLRPQSPCVIEVVYPSPSHMSESRQSKPLGAGKTTSFFTPDALTVIQLQSREQCSFHLVIFIVQSPVAECFSHGMASGMGTVAGFSLWEPKEKDELCCCFCNDVNRYQSPVIWY